MKEDIRLHGKSIRVEFFWLLIFHEKDDIIPTIP